jgi:hypothetical protein
MHDAQSNCGKNNNSGIKCFTERIVFNQHIACNSKYHCADDQQGGKPEFLDEMEMLFVHRAKLEQKMHAETIQVLIIG